jgi:hypothetical protein
MAESQEKKDARVAAFEAVAQITTKLLEVGDDGIKGGAQAAGIVKQLLAEFEPYFPEDSK